MRIFPILLIVSFFSAGSGQATTAPDHSHMPHHEMEKNDNPMAAGRGHSHDHSATTAAAVEHRGDDPGMHHQHMGHARAGNDAHKAGENSADFIRIQTPAGFSAVIGRANPLPELSPEIITDADGATVKVFRLTVKKVRFEIFPGAFIDGWGFNGSIPGPTIRVRDGDRLRIILTNETDDEHTVHVHGQKKTVTSDGVPFLGQIPVAKGQSYTYSFIANNPGTHWYHCHVDSAHHVDMGMYGAFIVEPGKQPVAFDREYILLLDEWPTSHKHVHGGVMPMDDHTKHGVVTEHQGTPPSHRHADEKPEERTWYPKTYAPYKPVYDGFSINGRSFPFTEPLQVRTGEKVLLRLINAGYQPHFMHIHAHKFTVVARSGAPVNEPQLIDTVMVGAGNRVDILLSADNPGAWPFHCHQLDHVANEHIYPGGMLTFLHYIDWK